MKNNLVVVLFISIAFISCTGNYNSHHAYELKPISFTTLDQSLGFKKAMSSLTIDSLGKTIYFQLNLRDSTALPFPVNSQFNDTLTNTAFHLDFYSDNELVESDYVSLLDLLKWRYCYSDTFLRLKTDTVDLRTSNRLEIQLPLYAFHKIKRGRNKFTLHIWQDVFTDAKRVMKKDSTYYTQHLYAIKPLLSAKYQFEIYVPTIYKSIIYGNGLELKNDSTFSPAGMDNTIWRSSYPDIYWGITYPKYNYYVHTLYEGSTDKYVSHDTFSLYHYYPNDTIGFGVYDHDNLSRDDVMGEWSGKLDTLYSPVPLVISFDYIKSFSVSAKKIGAVN